MKKLEKSGRVNSEIPFSNTKRGYGVAPEEVRQNPMKPDGYGDFEKRHDQANCDAKTRKKSRFMNDVVEKKNAEYEKKILQENI